jgi:hypothetical protein
MPMTAVDRAIGGFGPEVPVKLPPATPPSALRAFRSDTGLPAVKENGCMAAANSIADRCLPKLGSSLPSQIGV